MQFTFTLVAALSYVFLSALSGIEGAPVGKVLDATTVKALVPEAQKIDCGVTGGPICQAGHSLPVLEALKPETVSTTPCGTAGAQSCNVADNSENEPAPVSQPTSDTSETPATFLCGTAGAQSCNIMESRNVIIAETTPQTAPCGTAGAQSCNVSD